jgi:hypothetical protein
LRSTVARSELRDCLAAAAFSWPYVGERKTKASALDPAFCIMQCSPVWRSAISAFPSNARRLVFGIQEPDHPIRTPSQIRQSAPKARRFLVLHDRVCISAVDDRAVSIYIRECRGRYGESTWRRTIGST